MDKFDCVYHLIAKIPRGKVTTYKYIAGRCSINHRQVGYILHRNPDPNQYPCHRVVSSKGYLASNYAFGGPKQQAKLLEKEKVTTNNSRLNLKQYLWKG